MNASLFIQVSILMLTGEFLLYTRQFLLVPNIYENLYKKKLFLFEFFSDPHYPLRNDIGQRLIVWVLHLNKSYFNYMNF